MDSTTTKTITLGGRAFKLAPLPFKANRIVVPAADFAWKALRNSLPVNMGGNAIPLNVTAVDNIYLAVFTAVNCADPKVTREEFDSWALTVKEMEVALVQVCFATGVLSQAQAGGNDTSGEG